jgi:hypothetical protein
MAAIFGNLDNSLFSRKGRKAMKINDKKIAASLWHRFAVMILIAVAITTVLTIESSGQVVKKAVAELEELSCDEYAQARGFVWAGKDPKMTFEELVSYCAPIIWFSPDEPLLEDKSGLDIRLPQHLPFEDDPDSPVLYYRIDQILTRADAKGETLRVDESDWSKNIIDLSNIAGIDLKYFFYYPSEEGLGGHQHDLESAEFKVSVWPRPRCKDNPYVLLVSKVVGKAHGLQWYDNTLEVDTYTVFPMTILVEEGKHANSTDKNGDGYFTPGYDVNKRPNDAWGVRDVMRTGQLFTGGFQSWHAKVRKEEHRVFPPLPEDSLLRNAYIKDGEYAPDNAKYILRPLPSSELADARLKKYIDSKGAPEWPDMLPDTDWNKFTSWIESESFIKSLSIAYRYDGDHGFSFVFPLFVVKSFEDPLAGGYLTHRMYLKDHGLRDFGWMLHYTPSASRWVDTYISAGVEWDVYDLPEGSEKPTKTDTNFVLETGIKLRFNVQFSPFKFLAKLTDFWGLRIGIRNVGAFDINRMVYVIELGAGVW